MEKKANQPNQAVLYLIAGIAAYFTGGIVYYAAHIISNSYEMSGLVSLVAMVVVFFKIITSDAVSRVDIEHPPALLVEMPPDRSSGRNKRVTRLQALR